MARKRVGNRERLKAKAQCVKVTVMANLSVDHAKERSVTTATAGIDWLRSEGATRFHDGIVWLTARKEYKRPSCKRWARE